MLFFGSLSMYQQKLTELVSLHEHRVAEMFAENVYTFYCLCTGIQLVIL